MLQYNRSLALPTAEDLPETDHQPVDNELQILIPTLLRAILALAWAERSDWFLGVNLGLYYAPKEDAIGPDALLSIGVERFKSERLRLSYVLWEEQDVMPQWVLEIVSKTPGGEYDSKFQKYAEMGMLYYTIYNSDYGRRDGHERFEVYRLENGNYIRQAGTRVWMPEVGLAIGCEGGIHEGYRREWLYWYDEQGNRYPAPDNVIQQERQRAEQERQRSQLLEQQLQQERLISFQEQQRAEQERQRADHLAKYLWQQGIDPDNLP